MLSRDEVYVRLSHYLTDMFEVPDERIRPDARLFEDLDLDSIDALDLVVKLQEITGRRIAPKEFKTVRTVRDVVDKVVALLHE
jgi:acyl carrier protein